MTSPAQLILPDGRTYVLHGSCTIGRHADNHLAFPDGHVSGYHALIQWQQHSEGDGGGFQLVDLGSTNGSHVDGRRVTRPVPLKDKDVIDLGGTRIEFSGEADAVNAVGTPDRIGSTMISLKDRKVWLMVADIIGSTPMARNLTAKEVAQINGQWFKSCRGAVEAHEGHMNQYLGDGFLCYWDHEPETPERVTALLRHFAGIQRGSKPPFRVVLHFGSVVLGSVPTLSALNLHGPQVNFVFRMEKLAAGLGETLLLSNEAADALGLPIRTIHEAEIAGFDGKFSFSVPELEG